MRVTLVDRNAIGPRRLREIRRSLVRGEDRAARRVAARSASCPAERFSSLRRQLVQELSKELDAEEEASAREVDAAGHPTFPAIRGDSL